MFGTSQDDELHRVQNGLQKLPSHIVLELSWLLHHIQPYIDHYRVSVLGCFWAFLDAFPVFQQGQQAQADPARRKDPGAEAGRPAVSIGHGTRGDRFFPFQMNRRDYLGGQQVNLPS